MTLALCGRWEHEPPCPLSPHHARSERAEDGLHVRVLFAADPANEPEVRRRVDQALSGQWPFPEGFTASWRLRHSWPSDVTPDETAHAERLIRGCVQLKAALRRRCGAMRLNGAAPTRMYVCSLGAGHLMFHSARQCQSPAWGKGRCLTNRLTKGRVLAQVNGRSRSGSVGRPGTFTDRLGTRGVPRAYPVFRMPAAMPFTVSSSARSSSGSSSPSRRRWRSWICRWCSGAR